MITRWTQWRRKWAPQVHGPRIRRLWPAKSAAKSSTLPEENTTAGMKMCNFWQNFRQLHMNLLFPAYQSCLPSSKFVTGIVAASFATVAATTKCNFPAPRSQCVSVTTATPCWSTSNLKCSRFCQAALDHSRLLVRSTYFQHNCPACVASFKYLMIHKTI